jgi:hypothetical protein
MNSFDVLLKMILGCKSSLSASFPLANPSIRFEVFSLVMPEKLSVYL